MMESFVCTRVIWVDHCSNMGWVHQSEELQPAIMSSIGAIVKEDENVLVISTTVAIDDTYADPLIIVKSCILNRRDFAVQHLPIPRQKKRKGRARK